MTYFNKKEDVYHIELTPYGRYLLSIGKLDIKSYAFFDDDVIYDADYQWTTEEQDNTKIRIQDQTPYMRPNGSHYSVTTNFNTMESEEVYIQHERRDVKFESFHYMKDSIGTHEHKNNKSTNFKVDFLNNRIKSFEESFSPSVDYGGQISQIPQINLDIEYKVKRNNVDNNQSSDPGLENLIFSTVFSDGSYIDVLEEDAIIQIQELNSEYLSKNFKLEVFVENQLADPTIGNYKTYRPLLFKRRPAKIVDGMLVDNQQFNEEADEINNSTVDNNYVEYYFDINVDKEIASEEICALLDQVKERNFYISNDFDCADLDDVGLNIYSSNVGPDDLEEC